LHEILRRGFLPQVVVNGGIALLSRSLANFTTSFAWGQVGVDTPSAVDTVAPPNCGKAQKTRDFTKQFMPKTPKYVYHLATKKTVMAR
jgi:hypothetical protein